MQRTDPAGHEALINSWWDVCSSSLNPLDLGQRMIQGGLIHPASFDSVRAETTDKAQLHSLLNHVERNGTPGTFEKFVNIIASDSSAQWLADKLVKSKAGSMMRLAGSEPLSRQRPFQGSDAQRGMQRQLSSSGNGWEYVDDSELGDDDFFDVKSALGRNLDGVWKDFGTALGISVTSVKGVSLAHPGDPGLCLFDVVHKWLCKDYNHQRFGLPSWRALVKAVASNVGGQNPALAEKIAQMHLCQNGL